MNKHQWGKDPDSLNKSWLGQDPDALNKYQSGQDPDSLNKSWSGQDPKALNKCQWGQDSDKWGYDPYVFIYFISGSSPSRSDTTPASVVEIRLWLHINCWTTNHIYFSYLIWM